MEERYDHPDGLGEAGEGEEPGEAEDTNGAETDDYRQPKVKRYSRFFFSQSPAEKLLLTGHISLQATLHSLTIIHSPNTENNTSP